jgi:hypothetical protein
LLAEYRLNIQYQALYIIIIFIILQALAISKGFQAILPNICKWTVNRLMANGFIIGVKKK